MTPARARPAAAAAPLLAVAALLALACAASGEGCAPGTGGRNCRPCGSGKFSFGGTFEPCKNCPNRRGAVNANRSRCDCKPGVVDDGVCQKCAGGYGGNGCKKCLGKTWSPGGGLAGCKTCSTDTNNRVPSVNGSLCVCKAGYQQDPQNLCTACEAGYGGPNCGRCTATQYSLGGTTDACLQCPQRMVTNAGGNGCVCKEGVVVDKNCDKCLPGFGGYYCDRCAPNQVAPGGGVDECATCPNGTVPNPTKSKCVKICGPGEGGLPDESDCVICPRGSFSAGGDVTLPQPACQACPVGVSTDRNGSTSDAECTLTLCNPGRGGPQCSPCERGAFSAGGTPADPKAACRLCFNQKTTAGEGSQNATECSVQICTAGTGGTSCDPCAVGYWSAGGTLEDPMAPCARCDGLFTTNVTKGAPSPDFCKVPVCDKGQGGAACAACAVGFYSPGGTSDTPTPPCIECPNNKTTDHPGSDSVGLCTGLVCPPGTGGKRCATCSAGSYAAGGNKTVPQPECAKCPAKTTTKGTGSTSLDDCALPAVCSIQIKPSVTRSYLWPAYLRLREVAMYDIDGNKIAPLSRPIMSSSVNGKTVDGCFDGNVMAIGCETSPEDSNPFIIAEYACSLDDKPLARVVVHNDVPFNNTASNAIRNFQMEFVDQNGVTLAAYPFDGLMAVYTFWAPSFPSTCQISISPVENGFGSALLQLAEVRLFWADKSPMQNRQMTTVFMSTATTNHDVTKCFDGDRDVLGCQTLPDDPGPTLTVSYECAKGLSALDRVEIFNYGADDAEKRRFLKFQLSFISATGVVESTTRFDSQWFQTAKDVFSIKAPESAGDSPICKVAIRYKGGEVAPDPINLAVHAPPEERFKYVLRLQDVRLYTRPDVTDYNVNPAQLLPGRMTYALSTTEDPLATFQVQNCFDGDNTTDCGTKSILDSDPALTISYKCPCGITSIQRVEVANTLATVGSGASFYALKDNIVRFKVDFISATGLVEASVPFTEVRDTYTVLTPSRIAAGAMSEITPVPCDPGSVWGETACHACPTGTWSAGGDATQCELCPAERPYTAGGGITSDASCLADDPSKPTGTDDGWARQISPDGSSFLTIGATLDCRKQLAALFASDAWDATLARAATRACGTSVWGEYEMRAASGSSMLIGKSEAMFRPSSEGVLPVDWRASGAGDYGEWWGALRAPAATASLDQIDAEYDQIRSQISPGGITAALAALPSAVRRIDAAAALRKAADARRVGLARVGAGALDGGALEMYYLVRSAAEAVDASIKRAAMPTGVAEAEAVFPRGPPMEVPLTAMPGGEQAALSYCGTGVNPDGTQALELPWKDGLIGCVLSEEGAAVESTKTFMYWEDENQMSDKLSVVGEVKGSYFGVTAGLGADVAIDTMSSSKAVHGWLFARILKERVSDASPVTALNALEFTDDAKKALRRSKAGFEQLYGRYVVVGHRTGGIFSFSQSIFSNERVSTTEIFASLSASGYGQEASFETTVSNLRSSKSVNVQQQDRVSSPLYQPDGSGCDMNTLTGASICADLWRSTENPNPPRSAYYAYAVPFSILKPYKDILDELANPKPIAIKDIMYGDTGNLQLRLEAYKRDIQAYGFPGDNFQVAALKAIQAAEDEIQSLLADMREEVVTTPDAWQARYNDALSLTDAARRAIQWEPPGALCGICAVYDDVASEGACSSDCSAISDCKTTCGGRTSSCLDYGFIYKAPGGLSQCNAAVAPGRPACLQFVPTYQGFDRFSQRAYYCARANTGCWRP